MSKYYSEIDLFKGIASEYWCVLCISADPWTVFSMLWDKVSREIENKHLEAFLAMWQCYESKHMLRVLMLLCVRVSLNLCHEFNVAQGADLSCTAYLSMEKYKVKELRLRLHCRKPERHCSQSLVVLFGMDRSSVVHKQAFGAVGPGRNSDPCSHYLAGSVPVPDSGKPPQQAHNTQLHALPLYPVWWWYCGKVWQWDEAQEEPGKVPLSAEDTQLWVPTGAQLTGPV